MLSASLVRRSSDEGVIVSEPVAEDDRLEMLFQGGGVVSIERMHGHREIAKVHEAFPSAAIPSGSSVRWAAGYRLFPTVANTPTFSTLVCLPRLAARSRWHSLT